MENVKLDLVKSGNFCEIFFSQENKCYICEVKIEKLRIIFNHIKEAEDFYLDKEKKLNKTE